MRAARMNLIFKIPSIFANLHLGSSATCATQFWKVSIMGISLTCD